VNTYVVDAADLSLSKLQIQTLDEMEAQVRGPPRRRRQRVARGGAGGTGESG